MSALEPFEEQIAARTPDWVDAYVVEREAEGWVLVSREARPSSIPARYLPEGSSDHLLNWNRPPPAPPPVVPLEDLIP